jgi:hypothetical protein
MLSATPEPQIHLIWEPFNLRARSGVRDAPFEHWFTYVDEHNADRFEPAIRDMLASNYRMGVELRSARSPKDLARAVRDRSCARRARRNGALPLCKDPMAVFSAPWLASTFDMDVVVCIRHPAAMVASVMKLGWRHPFEHFIQQPEMMNDVLADHAETIAWFAQRERSLLDQASMLWTLIYGRVLEYRDTHPEWLFVRHEDLSRAPLEGYEKLYADLGLVWTPAVAALVEEHSSPHNAIRSDDPADHRRNSLAAVGDWRTRLEPEQVDRIRDWTEPVSLAFYGEHEW